MVGVVVGGGMVKCGVVRSEVERQGEGLIEWVERCGVVVGLTDTGRYTFRP